MRLPFRSQWASRVIAGSASTRRGKSRPIWLEELIAPSRFSKRWVRVIATARFTRISFAVAGVFMLFVLTLVQSQVTAQHELTAQQLAQRVDNYYNGLHSLRTSDSAKPFTGWASTGKRAALCCFASRGRCAGIMNSPAGKDFSARRQVCVVLCPRRCASGAFIRVAGGRCSFAAAVSPRATLNYRKSLEGLTLSSTAGNGLRLSGVPKGMQNRVSKIVLGVSADGVIHSMSDQTRPMVRRDRVHALKGASQGDVRRPGRGFRISPAAGQFRWLMGLPPI